MRTNKRSKSFWMHFYENGRQEISVLESELDDRIESKSNLSFESKFIFLKGWQQKKNETSIASVLTFLEFLASQIN